MAKIHNRQNLVNRRRELRKNSTAEEMLLWQYIRAKKIGFKFYRQHSIGCYIVDFYCSERKLIIELDGNRHIDNIEYDIERKYYLENLGNKVIRFWNAELRRNIDGVLNKIKIHLSSDPSLY